jgi:methylase of polypeptide subunit release factors
VDRLPVAASLEPRAALDGGADGMAFIGRLIETLDGRTSELGVALLEIGPHLLESMAALVARSLPGWRLAFHDDLAGRARVAEVSREA